jgi:multiple sugar transport system permease protein
MKKKNAALRESGMHLIFLLIALAFVFPFLWSAVNSLKPAAEASASPPTFLPSVVSFQNFAKMGSYGAGLGVYFFNSLMAASMTMIMSVFLSVTAGYGFARFRFPFKNAMFLVIILTMVLPFQTIITPLFFFMNWLGLTNSLFGLALVYTVLQVAFGTLIMRNTFSSIPLEIEEAARIDGCNSAALMLKVMMPLATPGIITVGIIAFINSWNEFLASLIFMSKESLFTLPVMLSNIRTGPYGSIDWGELQAGLIVATIPCMVLFLVLQRRYISGLTSGSVKG